MKEQISRLNHPQRVSHYKIYEEQLLLPKNYIDGNATENDMKKIESLNDIQINIITLKDKLENINKNEVLQNDRYDSKLFIPKRRSKYTIKNDMSGLFPENTDRVIHLLLVRSGTNAHFI